MRDSTAVKMNIFDKIRYLFRPNDAKQELLRKYDSVIDDRLHGRWRVVNDSAENENSPYRDKLRAQARDLERNSDIVSSVLSALERNVISTGISIHPKILKADGVTEDEKLNSQIENLWWEWQNKCDTSDSYSFEDIQRMAVRRRCVDGGLLVVKCYSKQNGFKLQLREVDELDNSYTSAGIRVSGGVETDAAGKILKYHFNSYDFSGTAMTYKSEEISSERVLYLRNRTRPSQVREITPLASAISIIAHLNSYIEAVTVKERMLACFGIAITKHDVGAGMGRGSVPGQKKQRDEINITPGMVAWLEPGETVSSINPNPGSGSNMSEFVKIQTRMLAASLGLSYESVSRDMTGVSYSSARQALLDDQRTFKVLQDYVIYNLCVPVYEAWLDFMVLEGKVNISAAEYAKNRKKYIAHEWTPTGWDWVDPLKDIKANILALDAGFTTLEKICAENGQDWRDVLKQRSTEQEFIKNLKLEDETNAGNRNSNSDKTA